MIMGGFTMDSLFEKLGLYDFITVFMGGIIAESLGWLVINQCFNISLPSIKENIWFFLIVGYFIGLILHEVIVLVEKIFKYYFDTDFTTENKFYENQEDLNMAKRVKASVVKGSDFSKTTDKYVASVCCNTLQVKGNITSADRLKTQSELALSLSVATGVITIGAVIIAIWYNNLKIDFELEKIMTSVGLSGLLSVLFLFRGIRMHKYYIRSLIRTYAVLNGLDKNKGEQEI